MITSQSLARKCVPPRAACRVPRPALVQPLIALTDHATQSRAGLRGVACGRGKKFSTKRTGGEGRERKGDEERSSVPLALRERGTSTSDQHDGVPLRTGWKMVHNIYVTYVTTESDSEVLSGTCAQWMTSSVSSEMVPRAREHRGR